MQFHRLQPVCKELLYKTFHRTGPGILIGGFILFASKCHWLGVITVFVQWLSHMLSCWLWMMKETFTWIWQGLSCKIPPPSPNLSRCHVKYSFLDVYNRVILSMNLAQFTCGLCDSLDTFSVRTTEALSRAMTVYLLSAILFTCHTSETVIFTSNVWIYIAGLNLCQRIMSCQQPCVWHG